MSLGFAPGVPAEPIILPYRIASVPMGLSKTQPITVSGAQWTVELGLSMEEIVYAAKEPTLLMKDVSVTHQIRLKAGRIVCVVQDSTMLQETVSGVNLIHNGMA